MVIIESGPNLKTRVRYIGKYREVDFKHWHAPSPANHYSIKCHYLAIFSLDENVRDSVLQPVEVSYRPVPSPVLSAPTSELTLTGSGVVFVTRTLYSHRTGR